MDKMNPGMAHLSPMLRGVGDILYRSIIKASVEHLNIWKINWQFQILRNDTKDMFRTETSAY